MSDGIDRADAFVGELRRLSAALNQAAEASRQNTEQLLEMIIMMQRRDRLGRIPTVEGE